MDPVPTPKTATAGTLTPGAAPEQSVSLTHFCVTLSMADRRPEMIGAFEWAERTAGRLRDVPSAFKARYAAFTTNPA